jgi:hypothetical protein
MKIDKKTALQAIVAKNLIECGFDKSDLALKLFMSKASIYNKLNNPDSFTLKELRLLFKVLKFTQDEILRVI